MMRCAISFETLLNFYEEDVDNNNKSLINSHIAAECPSCLSRLQWIQRTLSSLTELQSDTVPDYAFAPATALFREKYTKQKRSSLLVKLLFDSRNQLSPAFARGNRSSGYHLLFSSSDHNIELWLEEEQPQKWYIIGQVLSENDKTEIIPQQVNLTPAGGADISIHPGASEFHIPSVSSGLYQIDITLSDQDICLRNVSVGV